jgi:hypothetical protein
MITLIHIYIGPHLSYNIDKSNQETRCRISKTVQLSVHPKYKTAASVNETSSSKVMYDKSQF